MQNSYNSLSNYLNSSFKPVDNYIIQEAEGGKKGLFGGWLSSFFSVLSSSEDKSKHKNPLMAKYAEIAKKEAAEEKKRLQEELKAEEDTEIAKLEALYQQNKRQLDLKSQQKVNAHRALQKQLKAVTARVSKTNIMLSASQNAAMIRKINMCASEAGLDNGDYKRMATLSTLIATKKDADGNVTVLSQQEIKDRIKSIKDKSQDDRNDEEKQFLSHVEEYNKLAKHNEKQMLENMSSDEFKEDFAVAARENLDINKAKEDLDIANEAKTNYENNVATVSKIDSLKKKHKAASDKADKEKTNYESAKNDPFAKGYNSENGEVDKLSATEIKEKLAELDFSDCKAEGNDETILDTTKVTNKLKNLGLNQKSIDAITHEHRDDNGSVISLDIDEIKTRIGKINDEDLDECAGDIKKKAQHKLAKAKAAHELAQTELNKTVDVDSLNFDDKEKLDQVLADLDLSDEDKDTITKYSEIPAADRNGGTYDPTSEVGKQWKKTIEDGVKKAKEDVDKIEANNKAVAKLRTEAENADSENGTSFSDSMKKQIDNKVQGVEAGEVITKDGKIGFYSKDKDGKEKFIEKPDGTNAKDEEEYLKARNEHVLSMDLDKVENEVVSVKSDPDNKGKYIVSLKDENGETITIDDVSEDEAINYAAQKKAVSVAKMDAVKKKQEAADALKEICPDGKLDKEKYKELYQAANKKDAKQEDINKLNALKYIVNNSDNVDAMFSGVDMMGNETVDSVKELLKDKDSIISQMNEIDKSANKDTDGETEGDTDGETETTNKNTKDEEDKEEDIDFDADEEDDDEELKDADDEFEEEDKNGNKTKLSNPAKIWHKKKKKNGQGTTKNYYNKDGESISPQEYNDKKRRYKERLKNKQTSENIYSQLKNYLIEMFG